MGRAAGNLGALATLAGLAYLANRDKNSPDAETAAPAAQVASQVAPQAAAQIEDESDRGAMTPDQTAYDKQPTAATPRPRPTTKPVAKPMGGSGRGGQGGATAEELAAYAASQKPKLKYQSLADRARAYEEERAKSGAGGMYGTQAKSNEEPAPAQRGRGVIDTSRINPNTLLPYKKGGKVKKMASGGSTSKGSSVKGWGIARGARKAQTY